VGFAGKWGAGFWNACRYPESKNLPDVYHPETLVPAVQIAKVAGEGGGCDSKVLETFGQFFHNGRRIWK